MSSDQDTRREGILRVAELAVAQYQAADLSPPVESKLRLAIAQARQDPDSSKKVEYLRDLMMNVPKLEALLTEQFPEGALPLPFRGTFAPCS
jgi:hypothetical protein